MGAIDWNNIQQRLEWEVSQEAYDQIRTVWLKHCDTELKQDMEGLLSTLTDDCIYTVMRADGEASTSQRWEGQQGAREFYTALFKAFPSQNWQPEGVVIGAQGVFSVVVLDSTQVAPWAGIDPSPNKVPIRMFIWFIWDRDKTKFSGELIYFTQISSL